MAAQLADAHRELDHLRLAMRHRGVIEQAKGILMGWLGIGADDAFGVLVGYSQRTNRKLVHAAVALLEFSERRGAQLVDAAGLPNDLQLFADLAQGQLDRRMDAAAIAAAPELAALVHQVRTSLPEPQPHAALVGAIEAGGAVRILAHDGFDEQVITGWERIPPNADVPLAATAATGALVLCEDRAAREERFPGSRSIPSGEGATVALPIELGGVRLGVLGLAWPDPRRFDRADVDRMLTVAHDAALPLAEDLQARGALASAMPDIVVEPGRARWFHATIDHLPVGVVLLDPVVADGELVDLTVVHYNPRAAAHLDDPLRPLGRRVSQLAPWVGTSPLWEALDEVWRSGTPMDVASVELASNVEGRRVELSDVTITRLGGLLVVGIGEVGIGREASRGS